jgi:probable non-F420 flavinoid oxidoreductase
MPVVGYHASHEQHPPSALLQHAAHAEAAGFLAVSSSDHFSPWSERQGESGFAWSWLGAAMQATLVPFGIVTAPGQRYHPAIVAQAIATLGEMFPGRLTVALGTGEASNEHITGERWPDKTVRQERLQECVAAIRALLRGQEVTVDGRIQVHRAQLWTLPAQPPPLIGAALTVETARWCGSWADGLITVWQPADQLGELIAAFREGGGSSKPVTVQLKVAWAESDEEALACAYDQWRTNLLDSALMADIERVEQFEIAARHVRAGDVRASVLVSADPSRHAAWIHEVLELGVENVFVHQVPKEQTAFIDVFGQKVLPEVLG